MVCGTRGFTDKDFVWTYLDAFTEGHVPERVIVGDAAGPDTLAVEWAISRGYNYSIYHADWSQGRGAGVIRNTRMIQDGKPTVVAAFWDGASAGTLDTIKKATHAGIPVHIIPTTAAEAKPRGAE